MQVFKVLLGYCIIWQAKFALTSEDFATAPAFTLTKINWQPVWDADKEVIGARHHHKDHESLVDNSHEYIPQKPSDEEETEQPKNPWLGETITDVCVADGRGLKNLLKQAKNLLPLEKIKQIIQAASSDPEVQQFKQLVSSPLYQAKAASLKLSWEYRNLRDYSCYKLKLDIKYYIEFLRSLLNMSLVKPEPEPIIEIVHFERGRPGIRGLVQDIRDALPKEKLKDLYERLLKSDPQLELAVKRLKSFEFKQIVQNLRNNLEYRQMRSMLIKVGVPLRELKELIDTALGWYGKEIESEKLDLLI